LVLRLLSASSGDQHLLLMEVKRSTASAADLEALGLSRREAEVVFWVAQGKTNREVATILALSPLTVRTHLEHVYKKLGVETRTAATVRALEALGWTGRFQESPWSAR
jgi:DNA-binding CsgD family transcriptional regulator